MPNSFTSLNSDLLTGLAEKDPKYNEEVKKSQSKQYNPLKHETRELFSSWFIGRHDAAGGLKLDNWDDLTHEQTTEFDNYVTRKMHEHTLKERGYSDDDIALMRQWDTDMKAAALNGTYDQMIQQGSLVTDKYREAAITQYHWDEAMFNKYVTTARTVANSLFDPDGDGIMNTSVDVLRTLNDFSKDEIKEIYQWMTPSQKRMMNFDGVHTAEQFAVQAKALANQQYALDHVDKPFLEDVLDFLKGVGAGILEGLSGLITLPTTLIGLGVGVFAGWDNPVTKWTTGAAKTVDDAIVGNYKKGVDYDENSAYAKVGGYVGQAIELAGEMALTAGGSAAVAGMRRAAVRGAEETLAKVATKEAAGAITKEAAKEVAEKATAKLSKHSAKLIEREAMILARKSGARKVSAGLIDQATERVVARAGIDVTSEQGIKVVAKAIEESATTATVRLARRGMLTVDEAALKGMSEGARKEFVKLGVNNKMIKTVGGKIEKSLLKEGALATVKEGAKVLAKEGGELAAKTGAKVATKAEAGLLRSGAKSMFNFSGFINRTSKIGKGVRAISRETEEGLKMMSKLSTRPGWISRTVRTGFGNTDALTKLFGVRAFANSLDQSRVRGYGGAEALARSTFAAASTIAVWGKMRIPGHSGLDKMYNNIMSKGAKGTKVASWFGMQAATVLDVGSKMLIDGSLQNAIIEGWGTDLQGNKVNPLEAMGKEFNWKTIGEKFLTATVMHTTTVGLGGARALYGHIPMVAKKTRIRSWEYINKQIERLPEKDKPWEPLWTNYIDEARRQLEQKDPKSLKDEGAVMDYAASLAQAEGHMDIVNEVVKHHIAYQGIEYGHDMYKAFNAFEGEINETFQAFNNHMNTIDAHPDYKETTPEQREFFRQAFLNKANTFDGTMDAEAMKEELDIEAYDPQDFAIAYALFAGGKNGGKEPTMADVEAAFKKLDKVKKAFGKEIWEKMTGFSFKAISELSERMLDVKTRGKARKYINFRKDVNALLDQYEGKRTPEFYEALNAIMREHDYTTAENNEEIAGGMSDAQEIHEDMDKAEKMQKSKVADALNDKEEVGSIVDKVMEEVAFDEKIEKNKKPFEAFKRIKEAYEKPIDGKKITTQQYHELIVDMYEKYSKHAEYKKYLETVVPVKEFRDIYKANKTIKKIQAKIYPDKNGIEMSGEEFQSAIDQDFNNLKEYEKWVKDKSEKKSQESPVSLEVLKESLDRLLTLKNTIGNEPDVVKAMSEYFGTKIKGITKTNFNTFNSKINLAKKALAPQKEYNEPKKLTEDDLFEMVAEQAQNQETVKSKVDKVKNKTKNIVGDKNIEKDSEKINDDVCK